MRRLCLLFMAPSLFAASGSFIRGDVNQDGFVGVPDLVALENAIGAGTLWSPIKSDALLCPDAADVNDDGVIDVADQEAFVALFFAASAPRLPAPYPIRGFDPTEDSLSAAAVERTVGVAALDLGTTFKNGREGDPPGGGSDLQYIHFVRRAVSLEPGCSLAVPIVLDTRRSLGGVSFALRFDSSVFSRCELSFENSEPSRAGGRIWTQTSLAAEGRLASACRFSYEARQDGWSRFVLAHLEIEARAFVPAGTTTWIDFEELPIPGRGELAWILNEVSDTHGRAYDLYERARPLEVAISPAPVFVRGELDGNGSLDIGDARFLLSYVFGGRPVPACPDAADVNDDGSVGVSDAIALLNFLWNGEDCPRPPFPEPAVDPTPDRLGACDAQPLGLAAY